MSMLLDALVWIDRVVNRLTGGTFYETLSSRAYRMDVRNQPVWGWTAKAINMLFFWQPDHCRKQWEHEQVHPLQGEMFPRDKLMHFGAGLGIALLFGWLLTPFYGFVAAAVAGALKEIQDRVDKLNGTPDVWDFVATCLGGVTGTTFLLYL
jgi:hypothetical protein